MLTTSTVKTTMPQFPAPGRRRGFRAPDMCAKSRPPLPPKCQQLQMHLVHLEHLEYVQQLRQRQITGRPASNCADQLLAGRAQLGNESSPQQDQREMEVESQYLSNSQRQSTCCHQQQWARAVQSASQPQRLQQQTVKFSLPPEAEVAEADRLFLRSLGIEYRPARFCSHRQ